MKNETKMKTFDRIKISFTLDAIGANNVAIGSNLSIDYFFLYDSDKVIDHLVDDTGTPLGVTRGDLMSADEVAQAILVDLYRSFHMNYVKVEKSVKKKSYKRIPKKYQLI